jgi:hypothetical protein
LFVACHGFVWTNIWHFDFKESLILSLQVAKAMKKRVNLELLLPFCLVKDPIASKKHKISEFIALRLVAFQSEIKN